MALTLRWRPGGADKLLFVVHGYAEHPAAALLLGSILDPTTSSQVCAPEGGLDLGRDRRTFYWVDFKAKQLDADTFVTAFDELNDALDEACEESGTARENATLAGFSQGGGLSLALALGKSDRPAPAKVVVFSGMLYGDQFVEWDFDHRSADVFWVHGTGDDRFSIDQHRMAVARLEEAGVAVTAREVEGGHVLTPEGLGAARDWLNE